MAVAGSNDQLTYIDDVQELVANMKNNNLVEYIEVDGGHLFPFLSKNMSFFEENIMRNIKYYNP
jgi:hypothetical protein